MVVWLDRSGSLRGRRVAAQGEWGQRGSDDLEHCRTYSSLFISSFDSGSKSSIESRTKRE